MVNRFEKRFRIQVFGFSGFEGYTIVLSGLASVFSLNVDSERSACEDSEWLFSKLADFSGPEVLAS
jgi:hypothetical protein